MASTFAVTRNHLIFGLCLPLAVLLGYLLAEPYAETSIVFVGILFAILVIPILMRWYHPLLILSWNLAVQPVFFPGRLSLWVGVAFAGLFFIILNRTIDPNYRIIHVPALTWPMITLLAVVVVTALAAGGIGLRVLGSKEMGGKSYVILVGAIVGYFVLSSQMIKPKHTKLAVTVFFLAGISYLVGQFAMSLGPLASVASIFFPSTEIYDNPDSVGQIIDPGTQRLSGLTPVSIALSCWMLSRYGVTGVLALERPWRLLFFVGVVAVGCLGGFRSMLILLGIICLILIYLERLWRTQAFLILIFGLLIVGSGLAIFSKKLPFSVQRAISFLPVQVDPMTRQIAEESTEWRLQMWKSVAHQIPDYLLLGKGYNLSGTDFYMLQQSTMRGYVENWESHALAGDYHSGPLSVIIPFGIWGGLAFLWLLYAGTRYLYQVYQDGAEHMKVVNRFLLALFVARILFFLFVFGALYTELYYFTGILGLSVALNSAYQPASSHEAEKETGLGVDEVNDMANGKREQ